MGERAGQLQNRALAGRVGGESGSGRHRHDRSEIDDPTLRPAQLREKGADHRPHAIDIDAEHVGPVRIEVLGVDRRAPDDAGIVDQDGRRPAPGLDLLRESRRGRPIRHVEFARHRLSALRADRRGGGLDGRPAQVAQRHARAGFGQAAGDRQTIALRGARDDRHLSLDALHEGLPVIRLLQMHSALANFLIEPFAGICKTATAAEARRARKGRPPPGRSEPRCRGIKGGIQ